MPRPASTAGIRGSGGADPSPRAQFLRASAAGVDAEAKEGQTGLHAAAEGGDAVKLNKLLRALRAGLGCGHHRLLLIVVLLLLLVLMDLVVHTALPSWSRFLLLLFSCTYSRSIKS